MRPSSIASFLVVLALISCWPSPLRADCHEKYPRQKFTGSDVELVDWFGTSVAIDGDVAVIGVPGDDDPVNSGAAYVFRFDGTAWVEEQRLKLSDAKNDEEFG